MATVKKSAENFVRSCLLFLVTVLLVVGVCMKREFKQVGETLVSTAMARVQAKHATRAASITPTQNDGCGLHDGKEAQWVPYSQLDYEYLAPIRECKQRLVQLWQTGDNEWPQCRKGFNLTKLECSAQQQNVTEIMSNYKTIHFIGDSLLRQQALVLVCSLNSSTQPEEFVPLHSDYPRNLFFGFNITVPHAKGYIDITFTPFGLKFAYGENPKPLDSTYPQALKGGPETGIILNTGIHYSAREVTNLVAAVQKMMSTANSTQSHVFFMESTPQEWPTSNGVYADYPDMCEQPIGCRCTKTSQDKLQGRGPLLPGKNFSKFGAHVRVPKDPFLQIYPDLDLETVNGENCIPNCLSPSWRNDVVQQYLNLSSTVIQLVPQFWQFVARDIPNHVNDFDCTHLGADTVLESNRQLIRAMSIRQSPVSLH